MLLSWLCCVLRLLVPAHVEICPTHKYQICLALLFHEELLLWNVR